MIRAKVKRNIHIITVLLAFCISLFFGVACTKNNPHKSDSVSQKIEIVGAPQEVKLSDGNVVLTVLEDFRDKSLVWSSSNSDVITVENGVLTFNSEGICTITVRLRSDPTNSCTVKIKVVDDTKLPSEDDEIKVWSFNRIEGNDGMFGLDEQWNFAVTDGKISLYSPELVKAEEGWANKNTFTLMYEKGESKLLLESQGSHNYDILYLKFDQPIYKDAKYDIKIDFDWLGELDGNFGYMILSGENIDFNQVDYTPISQSAFFDEKQTISFIAKEDADKFYIYLREGDGQNSDACHFNIKINSVSCQRDLRIRNDGTFDDTFGCVSLYTSDDAEIENYTWMSETTIRACQEGENTYMAVESNHTHDWSGLFIRFDLEIEKYQEYEISFDAAWLGETGGTGFYWCICTDVSDDGYHEIGFDELFKKGVSMKWSTNRENDHVYLKIINNNGVSFDFSIDTIKIETVKHETKNDFDTLVEGSELCID